ncbi:Z-ring formation inhibitor MciZ, partial [Niallia hominis]
CLVGGLVPQLDKKDIYSPTNILLILVGTLKIYLREKGVVLTGKPREIRYMLKKYQKEYTYVKDWVNANSNPSKK